MPEQFNICMQSIELLDTMGEGLAYLHKRLEDGFLEESYYMFGDLNEAASALEYALASLNDMEGHDEMQAAREDFKRCMEELGGPMKTRQSKRRALKFKWRLFLPLDAGRMYCGPIWARRLNHKN